MPLAKPKMVLAARKKREKGIKIRNSKKIDFIAIAQIEIIWKNLMNNNKLNNTYEKKWKKI